MLKSFKTEIAPTPEQKDKIHRTIGTCRYLYNFFLAHNKERYEAGEKYLTAKKFSVWLNNEYVPSHPEVSWIKEVSSKAVKKSLENANTAFMKFFRHESGYPRFKKKSREDVKMYFVKTDKKAVIHCERHRIKIPTLGWTKLKEKGYIPTTRSGYVIRSGTVSMQAGRYYVSVLVEVPDETREICTGEGIGIDLGLKELAVLSDGRVYGNINRTSKVRSLEKELRREQRSISRKYENKKKGKTQKDSNINKQKRKIQKLHQRIARKRTEYIDQMIAEIVKTKPSYIGIEDLNVSGMMKNRHLSKGVASQKFYEFRRKLEAKCKKERIELRVADRFYASSKICHSCGRIKRDLKLIERIYRCECGYTADRDYNASLNLRDMRTYKVV